MIAPLLGVLLSLSAHADPLQDHLDLYRTARDAETSREYTAAVEACTQAVELLPTGPRAATCKARLAWMEARRDDDGGFGALSELQAVREDYRALDPDVAATRVAALRERPGISELVWVDAGLWLARDALERREDPQAALSLTEPIVASHQGPLRRSAVGLHAIALAQLGRSEEALAVEQEIRVAPPGSRLTPVEQIGLERRIAQAVWASVATVAAFVALALPLAWRSRREPMRPWGLVPIGVATLGAGALADRYADGAGAAGPWMFAGFAAVHLLAGPARKSVEGSLRIGVGALAALATVSIAVLSLYWTETLAWVLP